jgi:hypothetical protein
MSLRPIPAVLVAIAIALIATGAPAHESIFAEASVGAVPQDFDPAQTGFGRPPRWEVVGDIGVPGGKAVAQVSTDRTNDRFPLLIYGRPVPADAEVRMKFKAVAGILDQSGGLAIRLQDANNYYVVRANALENNVRLYKIVDGRRGQLASADTPVMAKAWHELKLTAQGDRFTVWFNGRRLFEATDTTFRAPGRIALWTKADSVTWFGALDVKPLP